MISVILTTVAEQAPIFTLALDVLPRKGEVILVYPRGDGVAERWQVQRIVHHVYRDGRPPVTELIVATRYGL